MFHPALLAAQSVALAGVGFVPPSAIAVSDFKNATYSIGESSVAIGDMWESDIDWIGYSADDVVAGVGLQGSSGPTATSGLFSLLSSGFTAVIDFTLAAGGTYSYLRLFFIEFPNYSVSHDVRWEADTFLHQVYDSSSTDSEGWSGTGSHKTACTFSSSLLASSLDGAAAISIEPPGDPTGVTDVAVQLNAGLITVEKITFYEAQDAATLATLSA